MFAKQSGLSAAIATVFFKSLGFILSFLKHVIIAGVIGLSSQLDVFYLAIAIIGVLVSSWGHVFDVIAVPKIITLSKSKNTEGLKMFLGGMLTLSLLLSLLICSIFILFPNYLTYMAYGFDENSKQLLIDSFFWLIPAIIIFLPLSFAGSILKSFRQFNILYTSEIIGSLIVLFCIYYYIEYPNVLYWSYSLNIIVPFVLLYIAINISTKLVFLYPFSKEILILLVSAPSLFILHGSNYLFIFSDRFFATFLNHGDMSALAYATTLVLIIPISIGIPYYFLTIYADEKQFNQKIRKTNDMFSLAIFISLSSFIFFLIVGDDLISLLFERGKFTNQDTKRVSELLLVLSIMLFPLFIQRPIDQIFQVENQINIIVKRTLVGLLLNIFLNYTFIFIFNLGIFGVALATAISNWIILILSMSQLKKIKMLIYWKKHFFFICWLVIVFIPTILLHYSFLQNQFNNLLEISASLLLMGLFIIIGILFYNGREKQLFLMVLKKILKF